MSKKKELTEDRVMVEKEGLVALAIILIAAGMAMVQNASMDEPIDLFGGTVLMIAGIVMLVGRGRLKFHRWGSVANNWRGEDQNNVAEKKAHKIKMKKGAKPEDDEEE